MRWTMDMEDRRLRIVAIAGLSAVILLGVFLVVREFWPKKLPSGRWQRPPRSSSVVQPKAPVIPRVQP